MRLARDGAEVVVHYGHTQADALNVVTEITATGGRAQAFQAELTAVSDVHGREEAAHDCFGRLDILVNNAGTRMFGPIEDVTETDFDARFALNVKGAFFGLQETAQRLQDGGRLVNTSADMTAAGSPGAALYGGSKGALEQFTLALAKELEPRGIRVNTVSPSATDTGLFHRIVPPETQRRVGEAGRVARPEQVAAVVAFLVSAESSLVIGQNLRVKVGTG